MAENPPTEPPVEPVVPQARSGADSDPQPRRRKRATKPAKRASRTKSEKASAKGAEDSAPGPAGPPRKRTSRSRSTTQATAVSATTTASPEPPPPPPEPALTAEPGPEAEQKPAGTPQGSAAPGAWASAIWDAVRHLGQPPERLAQLAVAELGPRAAGWVAWLRATYPGASAAGIARLATRQAARYGWALTVLELGGPAAAPVHLSALAWVRATLALRIAAAYGHDPTDPRRADELLELLQLAPAECERPHEAALPGQAESGDALRALSRRLSAGFYLLGRFRPRRRRSPVSHAVQTYLSVSDQIDGLDGLAHRAVLRYRSRQP